MLCKILHNLDVHVHSVNFHYLNKIISKECAGQNIHSPEYTRQHGRAISQNMAE